MKGLLKIADCVFSTAAALAVAGSVLLTGCDMDSREGCAPYPRELNVTLPALTVADAVVVEPMGSRSAVSVEDDALFSVGLGPERGADASGERSLSTRADVTLSNVWVLQFDASGATKACAWVGTVAAGARVKAALQSGEGYTVWIVANGPAAGVLTTSNPATLSDFENKMLYTATPASDELIPLSGKLTNVKVLDNGQVLVGEDNTVVPEMTLTRAMARVDVLLEYDVDGADLDGVWLYQVPAGACYGLDDAVTDYPASGTVSNFAYRNGDTSGLAPTSSGSGTVTYTWYVGDNRRGQNPVIQWEKNKGSNNAPAMATYARIKSHESSDTAKGLFHDVYLGENVTTDFNVLRNRHYIYRVRIGGTLDDQKLLAERDDRVWVGTLEYLDGAPTVDPDLSLPIHVNGQTFKVTFNGYWTGAGIPVRATVVGGEELASGTAACQAGNTGSATFDIPKNEGVERQIEFAYEWKGDWNVIGIGTQTGYGITDKKVTPEGDIPGAGGDYTVTLEGAWEGSVKVRAWDGSKSLVNITVLTPGAGVNFSVPANESTDSREVTFQYQWGDEWIAIEKEPRTQVSGASISSATVTPAGDIPAEGKTYSLTLTGTIPSAGVEVRANISGADPVTGKVTASGAAVELAVPKNASYCSRTVTFEYLWTDTWIQIDDDYLQEGVNLTLEPEPDSKAPLTWAEAIEYCKNKGEGWRVPTAAEMVYFYITKPVIDQWSAFNASAYWTATIATGTDVVYINMSSGYMSYVGTGDQSKNLVRCIKGGISVDYPKVTTEYGGTVLVLKDENGGIDDIALYPEKLTESEMSQVEGENHKVSRKFRLQNVGATATELSMRNKEAMEYCHNLTEDGLTNWRLPTGREMLLIWIAGGAIGTVDLYKNDTGVGDDSYPYLNILQGAGWQLPEVASDSRKYFYVSNSPSWMAEMRGYWTTVMINFSNGQWGLDAMDQNKERGVVCVCDVD